VSVVTALRAGRRGRIAVYVDDTYLCSVSEALLARRRLYKGLDLDESGLETLRQEASTERVLADAHRLLAQRQRSREELRRRLLQKEHTEQAVAATLERLAGDGLLDDLAFAEAFVADKRRLGGWGSERIRRGLRGLGVDAETAERALAGSADDDLERALDLLRRRGAPQPPLEAARRRAYAALQRRGFSGSVCYTAVQRWIEGFSPD
jgi:SOS response regulatory protein OraA/RecX